MFFIGYLKNRKRKEYVKISAEMQELIKNYYTNESNCYICPGKKEYVVTGIDSDKKKIYKQKRLLAFTVHDLYINFLQEFSNSIHKLPKFFFLDL